MFVCVMEIALSWMRNALILPMIPVLMPSVDRYDKTDIVDAIELSFGLVVMPQ